MQRGFTPALLFFVHVYVYFLGSPTGAIALKLVVISPTLSPICEGFRSSDTQDFPIPTSLVGRWTVMMLVDWW